MQRRSTTGHSSNHKDPKGAGNDPLDITAAQFGQALRLANRLHRAPHGALMVKTDMIEGLIDLLDADFGACAVLDVVEDMEPIILSEVCAVRVPGTAAQRSRTRRPGSDPACQQLLQSIMGTTDAARDESTLAYQRTNTLVSRVKFTTGNIFAGIGISRHPESDPFTVTDRALLDEFHYEMRWVYDLDLALAAVEVASLSIRAKETFQYLLTGARESDIAEGLGLSQNTVHHYVKQVYQHFAVSSRGELLAAVAARGKVTLNVKSGRFPPCGQPIEATQFLVAA